MTDQSGLPDGQEFFKLNEVCKLANVQPYMLRFWGTEFSDLEANRSETGQRHYAREQVGAILEIRRLLFDEGLTIAGTRKRINAMREGNKKAGGAKKPAKKTAKKETATKSPPKTESSNAKSTSKAEPSKAKTTTKTKKVVDKGASESVKPLLAALKDVRSEVSKIVAEIKKGPDASS